MSALTLPPAPLMASRCCMSCHNSIGPRRVRSSLWAADPCVRRAHLVMVHTHVGIDRSLRPCTLLAAVCQQGLISFLPQSIAAYVVAGRLLCFWRAVQHLLLMWAQYLPLLLSALCPDDRTPIDMLPLLRPTTYLCTCLWAGWGDRTRWDRFTVWPRLTHICTQSTQPGWSCGSMCVSLKLTPGIQTLGLVGWCCEWLRSHVPLLSG